METTAIGKKGGALWSVQRGTPLSETNPGGLNARTRISLRVSAEAHKLGFAGSLLEGGWVTVEASLELPHSNTAGALEEAQQTAGSKCLAGIETGLQLLLARINEEEEVVRLLDAFLADPQAAVQQGIAEPMVRALVAAPANVWGVLTPEERKELLTCYPTPT